MYLFIIWTFLRLNDELTINVTWLAAPRISAAAVTGSIHHVNRRKASIRLLICGSEIVDKCRVRKTERPSDAELLNSK